MSYLLGTTPVTATSTQHLWDLTREIFTIQPQTCSLNHIDVSRVTNFSQLFGSTFFNGDISQWDMSNAEDISGMFEYTPFQGDLSKWNVSKVVNATCMFLGSAFNGDLSEWKPDNLAYAKWMFRKSKFEQGIAGWSLPCIEDIEEFCDFETLRKWPKPTLFHWYALLQTPACLRSFNVTPEQARLHRTMEAHAAPLQGVWSHLGLSLLDAARWLHEKWRTPQLSSGQGCSIETPFPSIDFSAP